jgi:hypothetical protein
MLDGKPCGASHFHEIYARSAVPRAVAKKKNEAPEGHILRWLGRSYIHVLAQHGDPEARLPPRRSGILPRCGPARTPVRAFATVLLTL